MSYLFEWDPKKALLNIRKHGVEFSEATTVFGDPLALLMSDPDHSEEEMRFILLGRSSHGNLLVISFVERPPRTRLISARPATNKERKKYEENE